MEIQLAFIILLSDSTEGLHSRFGHILISSGTTAFLVLCGFVSGNDIMNIIGCTCLQCWHIKHCIPWLIYT